MDWKGPDGELATDLARWGRAGKGRGVTEWGRDGQERGAGQEEAC